MKSLQLEVVVVVALLAAALAAAAKPPSNFPGPEEFVPRTVLSLPWH